MFLICMFILIFDDSEGILLFFVMIVSVNFWLIFLLIFCCKKIFLVVLCILKYKLVLRLLLDEVLILYVIFEFIFKLLLNVLVERKLIFVVRFLKIVVE